jgi:hypothetical protein
LPEKLGQFLLGGPKIDAADEHFCAHFSLFFMAGRRSGRSVFQIDEADARRAMRFDARWKGRGSVSRQHPKTLELHFRCQPGRPEPKLAGPVPRGSSD